MRFLLYLKFSELKTFQVYCYYINWIGVFVFLYKTKIDQNQVRMQHGGAKHAETGKPLKHRRITQDMVLRATSLTKSSKESTEQYLQRVTHLHLQGKRIRRIENLDSCTNLKVLYLYDNQIEEIANLEFAGIVQYLLL